MGHWYTKDGKPQHTTEGKPTTLRHARKLNLFPSVTTVMDIVDKPGLNVWKQNQLYDACWAIIPEVVESGFRTPKELEGAAVAQKGKTLALAREIGKTAAELGTEIHGAFEEYFKTGTCTRDEFIPICAALKLYIEAEYGQIDSCEVSFTSGEFGYGGCIDIIGTNPATDEKFLLDLKTKDFVKEQKVKSFVWDSHIMQLAAYSNGVDAPRTTTLGNVFISTNDEDFGEIKHYTHSQKEAQRGWDMFLTLLIFWQIQKKYGPYWDDSQPGGGS